MSKSRLSMRREVEAAEAAGVVDTAGKTRKKSASSRTKAEKTEGKEAPRKKRVAKPRTKRAREAAQRRRLVWVVYSSTMREEGRFLYFERDKAEERLQLLLSKGKRRYFIQPIKEALNPDGTPVIQVNASAAAAGAGADIEEDLVKEVVGEVEAADDIDLEADLEIDGEGAEVEVADEVADDAPEV